MPIALVTGLPGAGKSLRLVQRIRSAVGQRPVYVDGLDGLQPFGWEPCDARRWQDLPDGALIVVDEAQKVWPSRRSGDPPDDIRALSEHRHRGFDFLLATQHPTMLDSYVRRLVGSHEHVLRQFGMQASRIVAWQECQDDPQSLATRQRGTEALWKYPTDCYPLYKSATQHTVKRKIPFRVLVLPVLFVAAVAFAVWGYRSVTGMVADPAPAPASSPQAKPQAGAFGGGASSVDAKYPTAEAYAAAFVPRVVGMPWSAPAFDGAAVASKPDVLCVHSEARGCQCYTEQITRLEVPILECLHIARYGIYNPFRQPLASSQAAPAESAPRAAERASSDAGLPLPSSYGRVPRPMNAGSAWPK